MVRMKFLLTMTMILTTYVSIGDNEKVSCVF